MMRIIMVVEVKQKSKHVCTYIKKKIFVPPSESERECTKVKRERNLFISNNFIFNHKYVHNQ